VRTVPPSRRTASVNVPPTSTPRIATHVLCTAVPIRAFLFDFDGLILDTETASRAGWQWLLPRARSRAAAGEVAS